MKTRERFRVLMRLSKDQIHELRHDSGETEALIDDEWSYFHGEYDTLPVAKACITRAVNGIWGIGKTREDFKIQKVIIEEKEWEDVQL